MDRPGKNYRNTAFRNGQFRLPQILIVVDQLATGLAMRRIANPHLGEWKTDARETFITTDAARPPNPAPMWANALRRDYRGPATPCASKLSQR